MLSDHRLLHALDLLQVLLPFIRIYDQENERVYAPPTPALTAEAIDSFIQEHLVGSVTL